MPPDAARHEDLADRDLAGVRAAVRSGAYVRHTAGLAPGRLQCNLAILPARYADHFLEFCRLNPKPCPVVGVGKAGEPRIPSLGAEIDIRSDVPAYRIWRDGRLAGEPTDVSSVWRDDLVSVALGCSFTFEHALIEAGIPVRNIACDVTVPMFRTTLRLAPAGPFGGGMVVSMRPIPSAQVEDAIRISSAFPQAHGAPVAVGDPQAIGIRDLSRPDYGDPVPVEAGEVPVFWACGVTPQNVLLEAALPFCITHKPGCMLIADVGEREEITVPAAPRRAPRTTEPTTTGSPHHA
jgi:uncharacterized protein YcsI (UPF0317 family)